MTKDWVHSVGHSPICQIWLQIVVRAVITSPPPAWTRPAGTLSIPADFPLFNDCTAASASLRRVGCSSSVSIWVQSGTDASPLALSLYSSEQYSVYRFSTSRSSVRHLHERSWIAVAFLCFPVVKSFTSRCAVLLLFFLRFSSISLHCSPIQFSFAFFMHLVMLFTSLYFRSFRFKSFLSQFSPIVAQIKNFCTDPGIFVLTMFAKDLTSCFSHCRDTH